ncbi:hypothetical protein AVEN_9683-1 [Araneus ventricosus]|uniref:Uncharacterized protein n=1 Tax=Araneus ventricosus TaxID=182803 RepID=A0A4Y2DY38_ARAVE|nr:hypothetical protein AVEN_9683-1 [Araneus ventricosus]
MRTESEKMANEGEIMPLVYSLQFFSGRRESQPSLESIRTSGKVQGSVSLGFNATRGLFGDGPRNFELEPPLQASAPHQREDIWPLAYDLECNKPTYKEDFRWNRGSNLESSGSGPYH